MPMVMTTQITLQSLLGLPASTLLRSSPLRVKHPLSQFANPVRQHIIPVLTHHCMATRLPRGRPSYRLPTILPEVLLRCPLIAHTSPGPDIHLELWSPDSAIVTSPPYEHEERQSRSAKHAASADAPHEETGLLEHPPVSYTGSVTSSTELSSSDPKGHGHLQSHPHGGSMNMRALLLHVLGDALGNVGVIATGLVIWLTSWTFKYYCDPIISLVITAIIFHSALPLGEFSASPCPMRS